MQELKLLTTQKIDAQMEHGYKKIAKCIADLVPNKSITEAANKQCSTDYQPNEAMEKIETDYMIAVFAAVERELARKKEAAKEESDRR